MRAYIGTAFVTAIVAIAVQLSAQDWPQYFGPKRNGAAEFSIPDRATLVETWRRPLLSGTSGITIGAGRAFVLGSDGNEDFLFAIDAGTGKDIWRASLGSAHADATNGPDATPVFVNGLVIAVSSSCRVHGIRATEGTVAWQRSLAEEYKSRFAARGGCGMSPVASGQLVVLSTGAQKEAPKLIALDAQTGKDVWNASDIPASLNGATGIADFGGVRQILYHHAKPPGISGLTALNADSGATMWQIDLQDGMSDTMPLALSANRVLLQTWKHSTVIEAGTPPRTLWNNTELSAAGPPPVQRDGYIFGFGGNSAEFLKCVDAANGQVKWSARPYRGSLLLVSRTLVMLSESSGLLRLIAADPTAYREHTRLQVLKPGARTMTPPSFSNGVVYVRNLDEIVAVAIK